MAAGTAKGSISSVTRRVLQIAVADIAQFAALVIDRRNFLGKRIDIVGRLTKVTVAAANQARHPAAIKYTALPINVASGERRSARMFRVRARWIRQTSSASNALSRIEW